MAALLTGLLVVLMLAANAERLSGEFFNELFSHHSHTSALAATTTDAPAEELRGDDAMEVYHYSAAVDRYQKCVAAAEAHADAHDMIRAADARILIRCTYKLGNALLRRGDAIASIPHYRRALAQAKKYDFDAHAAVAPKMLAQAANALYALVRTNRVDEAVRAYAAMARDVFGDAASANAAAQQFFHELAIVRFRLPNAALPLHELSSLRRDAVAARGTNADACARVADPSSSPCMVVLTRFNEVKTAWISKLRSTIPTVVVNRGATPMPQCDRCCEVEETRGNVGREAFIFLRWIIDNYDTPEGFADANVFCQAEPNHYTYNGGALASDVNRLCAAPYEAAHGWQPGWQQRINKLRTLGFGHFGVWAFPFEFGSTRHLDKMDFFYTATFGKSRPRRRTFVPGGCFFVSRSRILAQSKAFYERLIAPLSHAVRPDFGFLVEKTWTEIFGVADVCDARQHAPEHGKDGFWGTNKWPCLVARDMFVGPKWLKTNYWHVVGHG